MADKSFEIPQSLREMAEKNVDQAREAYDRFVDASRQVQDTIAKSSQSMTAGARDVQQKTLEFTQENMKSGFDLAEKLAKAKDLQEALEIQSAYAKRQMETYTRQAQELARLVAESGKGAGRQ